MKKVFCFPQLCFVQAVCLLSVLFIASCSGDEPQQEPTHYGIGIATSELIKASDDDVTICQQEWVYRINIPAQGGDFVFTLSENAALINAAGPTPLTLFDFTPSYIFEREWSSNTVPVSTDDFAEYVDHKGVDNPAMAKELTCPFGKYTATTNGFTLHLNPNLQTKERSYIVRISDYPEPKVEMMIVQGASSAP